MEWCNPKYIMRNVFFLILLIYILPGCRNNSSQSIAEQYESLFKPMVQEEIIYVTKNLEGLKNDRGKDWYESDSMFYTSWLNGANEEQEGDFKDAVKYYIRALNTKRYEMSSYEVKLSLGRAYLQLDEMGKARKMLTEFKEDAKKDLSGEEVEWGLTEEAKESLIRDIQDCENMLGMIDSEK
jgi:tetratricopeptide (TPR) repeat protein